MKKTILLFLALLLLAGSAGCGQAALPSEAAPEKKPSSERPEILSYERIDPARTQLVVSRLGNNANIEKLSAAFEAQNPDVQTICLDLTNGSPAYRPVIDWVLNGAAPDVMFVNPETFLVDAQITQYLTDLSSSPVIENFESEALSRLAVDGLAYFLPAPSEINCILYNKTLFDQYGWSVPHTFDEFVALCVQIREDTGGAVQPWNPNAKYDNVFSTAIEAFTYGELFGGADNRGWYNDFCSGKATFAGHMEPFFDAIQTLVDNGLLFEEHFSYSATTRGEDFEAGTLAMYNAPISHMKSDKYTFAYMPYPSTDGKAGYVNGSFSSVLCVPKKERTDAQSSAVDRFVTFFGSVEGQKVLTDGTLMASSVKGVPFNEPLSMAGIADTIAQGNLFNRLDFPGSNEVNWADRKKAADITAGYEVERRWTFRDCALAMVKGEKTAAELIAEIDKQPYRTAEEAARGSVKKLAEVAEDFSVLDFSCYIADLYREAAGAQIGLINHAVAYRGNLVRLFSGSVFDSYLSPIKPRSFANGSTLVKASMTGRQLLDALNHPVNNKGVSNSIYAFSGLRCEVAPYRELGSKYLSVKLADGSALEPDKLYTVAFWAGSVADEYVSGTPEAVEGAWEELMGAKMAADGTLAPANDGRITLVWD